MTSRSSKSGVDKFLSRRPNFRARNFTWVLDWARKKIGPENQSARSIEIQLETSLFALNYLNSTSSFYF